MSVDIAREKHESNEFQKFKLSSIDGTASTIELEDRKRKSIAFVCLTFQYFGDDNNPDAAFNTYH